MNREIESSHVSIKGWKSGKSYLLLRKKQMEMLKTSIKEFFLIKYLRMNIMM